MNLDALITCIAIAALLWATGMWTLGAFDPETGE